MKIFLSLLLIKIFEFAIVSNVFPDLDIIKLSFFLFIISSKLSFLKLSIKKNFFF